MFNMKRILVTGGAGFIGSHTVDLLLEQGMQVVVFDNLSSGKLSNLNLFHENFRCVQGDVLDFPLLQTELSRCDAVLHLAALSSVPTSIEDPIGSLKVNTLGFLNVLQAIREINKPIRLVYASSAAVYGEAKTLPCDDEAHLAENALSPYALQKADNERYADLYARLFGIKSLGLRYFNVYGSRQDPKSPYSGVISKFIERYQKQEPISIFGNGEQSRDFIYVTDVAKANWLALKSDYCGQLNVATGTPETLLNLVRYIESVGQRPADLDFAAGRVGDIPHSYAKVDKAARELAFKATLNLEQGMRLMMVEKE
jgi:UDP-glucose 4-epimerase